MAHNPPRVVVLAEAYKAIKDERFDNSTDPYWPRESIGRLDGESIIVGDLNRREAYEAMYPLLEREFPGFKRPPKGGLFYD